MSEASAMRVIHWARLNRAGRRILESGSRDYQWVQSWQEWMTNCLRSHLDRGVSAEQLFDEFRFRGEVMAFTVDGVRETLNQFTIAPGEKFIGEIDSRAVNSFPGGLNWHALSEDGWRPGMQLEFTATEDPRYPYETTIGSRYRTFKKHEVLTLHDE